METEGWPILNPTEDRQGMVRVKARYSNHKDEDWCKGQNYKNVYYALFEKSGSIRLFHSSAPSFNHQHWGKCIFFSCQDEERGDLFVMLNDEIVYWIDRTPLKGRSLLEIPKETLVEACSWPGTKSIPAETYREWCRAGGVSQRKELDAREAEEFERQRRWRQQQVLDRPGQRDFRNSLLAAYSRRCAMTGCNVVEALEAAHISPFKESQCDEISNGLLLRADIHTLFDMDLVGVQPAPGHEHVIRISASLRSSEYSCLEGRRLLPSTEPATEPCKKKLSERWRSFLQRNPELPECVTNACPQSGG